MKRITIFSGHYGSGKTNIAVNYALKLRKEGLEVSIADIDIVHPYFRTRDSEKELKEAFPDDIERVTMFDDISDELYNLAKEILAHKRVL